MTDHSALNARQKTLALAVAKRLHPKMCSCDFHRAWRWRNGIATLKLKPSTGCDPDAVVILERCTLSKNEGS